MKLCVHINDSGLNVQDNVCFSLVFSRLSNYLTRRPKMALELLTYR